MDKKNNPHRNFALALLLITAGTWSMKPLGAAQGARDLSIGVVKDVRCRGRRLDMNLKTAKETMHLYTANYFKVDFTAANFKTEGKLNPCKEITGMKATVVFYDVPRRPNEGELISVELTKLQEQ
jgi:hypothetical protein